LTTATQSPMQCFIDFLRVAVKYDVGFYSGGFSARQNDMSVSFDWPTGGQITSSCTVMLYPDSEYIRVWFDRRNHGYPENSDPDLIGRHFNLPLNMDSMVLICSALHRGGVTEVIKILEEQKTSQET